MNKNSLITIVGGGIIGKSACLALASSCYPFGHNEQVSSIHLLDAGPIFSKKHAQGFSNRVSFITGSSVDLFKKLNVWDTILNNHAWPVTRMEIFDSDISPGAYESISSIASMLGEICFQQPVDNQSDPLGYIVQNHVIESALDERLLELQKSNRIVLHEHSELIELDKGNWDIPFRHLKFKCKTIEKEEYHELKTNLLIGSDGSQSRTRSLLELPYHFHDYNHVGVVATLEVENLYSSGQESDIDHIAYQRFLSTGPIALLPLSETCMSLVWSVPKSFEQTLTKELTKEQFSQTIDLAFHNSLTDVIYYCLNPDSKVITNDRHTIPRILSLKSKVSSFPLKFGICPKSIAPNAILIGDAAHMIHPLAGQGLNLGLSDVTTLASLIQNASINGLSPSDSVNVLERYHMQRGKRNLAMISGCHALFNLFTTRSNFWQPPKFTDMKSILNDISKNGSSPSFIDILRRSGMNALNHLPFVKVITDISNIVT